MNRNDLPSRVQGHDLSIADTRKAIKHAYLRVNGAGEVHLPAPKCK